MPPSPSTPRPWTTAGPTTWSPPSAPTAAVEIPGMGTHRGHEALRDAYSKWEPRRPQRHLVLNTVVTEWSDTEATAVSDVVFLLLGELRLGDPARGPLPRHPPPRRRHLAVPPSCRHLRDRQPTSQGDRHERRRHRLRRHRLLPGQRARRRPLPLLRLAADPVPGAPRAEPGRLHGHRVRRGVRRLHRHRHVLLVQLGDRAVPGLSRSAGRRTT